MSFLSAYISELDSIIGDINIDLSLSGPSSAILRNGEITLSNSSIYTMLINNSIIAQYRDRALKYLQPSSVKRRLAIISNLFSIAKKEWGYNAKSFDQ